MALKKSEYEPALHRLDKIENKGYDYNGKVLRNSLSNHIYKEDKRIGMIDAMEPTVTNWVESVKNIKNFLHFAVPKFYRNRN